MAPVSVEELPEKEKALVKRAIEYEISVRDRHQRVCEKLDHWYSLFRSYRDFKRSHSEASRRDVDSVLNDGRVGFGTDLFIPYTFSVTMTTLARMMAQNPTLAVKPAPTLGGLEALMTAERNAENMRVLLEKQASMQNYHLRVSDVGLEGLIGGTGIGKTMWEERVVKGRKVVIPATAQESGGPAWVEGKADRLVYLGPIAEWISRYDFMTDYNAAHDADTMPWAIHRSWVSNAKIKANVESGKWRLPPGVKLEDVLEAGSDEQRNQLWQERMKAAGFDSPEQRGDHAHELWELWDWHEGDVVKILDRTTPVEFGDQPYWHGGKCFQLFRPTKVPGEFDGIGEPEAIEDLQEEMNVLRTQRRDNAAFVLQRPFFFFEGMASREDLEGAWAPGAGLPVDGAPADLIHMPTMQEIPNSSYQEEMSLQRDIERVTGIDDTMAGGEGGGGASATATGVQLVQQAAGVRIALKTKRLETEFVKEQARQFAELNQQKFGIGPNGQNQPIAMTGPPRQDDPEGMARGWSPYEMGPATLEGELDVEPVENSMAANNNMERQQRGLQLHQLFANDSLVDPVEIRAMVLDLFGFANPRSIIREPEETIEQDQLAAAIEMVAPQLGLDPTVLATALEQGIAVAGQEEAAMDEKGAAAAAPPEQQQAA
jgi:hypothetical protein